jgi:hypothetical protein
VTQTFWLYLRSVGLALGAAIVVALLGWLGDYIDVGPGRVPIWDPDGRGYWITGIVVVGLVAVIYQRFDRSLDLSGVMGARGYAVDLDSDFPTRWVLPAGVMLSAVLFLGVYRGTTAISVGALIAFIGLLAGTTTRHLMIDEANRYREQARLVYTLVVHSVAFLALAMIYVHKVRSAFSATAVLIVAFLMLIALTEGEEGLIQRRLVYALVGGIALGQVTWGLNYWPATGWIGGAVLLICFYFVGGLLLTHLRQGVQARDIAEYGTVGTAAFAILVYSLFA